MPPFPSSEAMSIIRDELGQDFCPSQDDKMRTSFSQCWRNHCAEIGLLCSPFPECFVESCIKFDV